MISGAISLAVNEVNNGILKELGHELTFVVAETNGEEISSIRQTAALWTNNVIGYIGPQETCVHEGRMAAAFNLPMISYVWALPFHHHFHKITNYCLIVSPVLHTSWYFKQEGFPHIRQNPSPRHADLQIGDISAAGPQLDTCDVPLFGLQRGRIPASGWDHCQHIKADRYPHKSGDDLEPSLSSRVHAFSVWWPGREHIYGHKKWVYYIGNCNRYRH